MASHGCLLLADAGHWSLASTDARQQAVERIAAIGETDAGHLAERVARLAGQHRLAAGRLAIGLDSTHVLAGSFAAGTPSETRDRRVMAFQLEHCLPLAAEEFVADFVVDKRHVLGVAVATAWLAPVVDALESLGMAVQTITPLAVAALESWLASRPANTSAVIIWQDGENCELFRLNHGRLHAWQHACGGGDTIVCQAAREVLCEPSPLPLVLINADERLTAAVSDLAAGETEHVKTEPLLAHARQRIAQVVEDGGPVWFELRRNGLAGGDPYRGLGGSLRLVYAAAAALLLVFLVGAWRQCWLLDDRLAAIEQQQAAVFREAFPGVSVPAAIVSRMRSEHAKVLGARGATGSVQAPVSALTGLHAFLQSLDDATGLLVDEVRVEGSRLTVDARLRTHAAAAALVTALEEQGFSVSPPSSVQGADGTVSTRLYAEMDIPSGAGGEGRR